MMHELNSIMIYVHPPLAVIGHILVFASLYPSFAGAGGKGWVRHLPFAAWLFVLAGLVSGMVWAQLAWGAYWSWDPKETATLLLFVGVSAHAYVYYGGLKWEQAKNRNKALRILSLINCLLVAAALSVTLLPGSMHSYA